MGGQLDAQFDDNGSTGPQLSSKWVGLDLLMGNPSLAMGLAS
jgi:hypothetical protein